MKSKLVRLLPAAVTAVAATILAVPGSASGTAGDLACTVSSTITFSPGITFTPSTQTITWSVSYSGCTSTTGATVTTGGRGGSLTRQRGCLSAQPPWEGSVTIVWDDSTTSEIDATGEAADVGGQTVYTLIGTVTSGRFAGDTYVETVAQSSLNLLACASTGVTSQTGAGAVTFA